MPDLRTLELLRFVGSSYPPATFSTVATAIRGPVGIACVERMSMLAVRCDLIVVSDRVS